MPIPLTVCKIMKKSVADYLLVVLLLHVLFCFTSCADIKKVNYFNVPKDTTLQSYTLPIDPVIQNSDLITVSITSLNSEASSIFNTSNGPNGYLVGTDGYIQFPVLGKIKAAGLTLSQFRSDLSTALVQKKLLVDPIVYVRFSNLRIIVLGEVGHAGVITFPNEQISIVEAIGQAGDLPVTANKTNVLLIREENGRKIFRHLDLTSSQIFSSPYYYLKSNDIVYVEPTKAKARSSTEGHIPTWVTFAISSISFVVGLSTLLLK